MSNRPSIPIRNLYYMLAYAFQTLRHNNYAHIAGERFECLHDLMAELLACAVARQLKQGLRREYATEHRTEALLRGKPLIGESIRLLAARRRLLACEADRLTTDNLSNRILRTAVETLLRHPDVASPRREALRRVLRPLRGITPIAPAAIPWSTLPRHGNDAYPLLLSLCHFVLRSQLLTTEQGPYAAQCFTEEWMHRLFERFVRAYYKRHHPALKPSAPRIDWALADTGTQDDSALLPAMRSDLVLCGAAKQLVVDTKYYTHTLQYHHDHASIRSGHLYQLFAYVKNRAAAHPATEVEGLLLYAKSTEQRLAAGDFPLLGNRLAVRTLDLDVAFTDIRVQLDAIAQPLYE